MPLGVAHAQARRRPLDDAVLQQHVELRVELLRRVDDAPARDQQPAHEAASVAAAEQQVEHGHPHRDAVRDLLEDHRVRAVGHLARDLDAAVHRPRVHHEHVLLRAPQALLGQAVALWYSRVVGKKPPAMRSSWMRSIMTTSAPSTASSMLVGHPREAARARAARASAGRRPPPWRRAWTAATGSSAPRGCAGCRRRSRP